MNSELRAAVVVVSEEDVCGSIVVLEPGGCEPTGPSKAVRMRVPVPHR